jgi:hypothetical protein
MMRLDYRPAKLNQDHTGKGKEIAGVVTKMLTFNLLEIPLDEGELCVITGDAYASRLLFDKKRGGLAEPTMPWMKTIYPDLVLKGAFVKVRLSGDRVYEFKDCKVEAVSWDRQTGGTTAMGCKITTAAPLDSTYGAFIEALGDSCDVAIDSELPTDQQDLPLSRHGEGEQPELGAKKSRGRKRKGLDRPQATH